MQSPVTVLVLGVMIVVAIIIISNIYPRGTSKVSLELICRKPDLWMGRTVIVKATGTKIESGKFILTNGSYSIVAWVNETQFPDTLFKTKPILWEGVVVKFENQLSINVTGVDV